MKSIALAAALAAAPLAAKTPPNTIAGTARATLTRPAEWVVTRAPSRLRMVAPEGDLTSDIVDVDGIADARSAAAAAWRIVDPAFVRPVQQASQDAAKNGWDELWEFSYENSPGESLVVRASPVRRMTGWTVSLLRGSLATLSKRSGAVIAAADSLRPVGVAVENFAGKPAEPQISRKRTLRLANASA